MAQNLCEKINIYNYTREIFNLIQQKYSPVFTNNVAEYIALHLQDINFNSPYITSIINELLHSNPDNHSKLISSIQARYNKLEDIFNDTGFQHLLTLSKNTDFYHYYESLLIKQFSSLNGTYSEEFYSNLNSFLSQSNILSSKPGIKLALKNLPLACNLLTFSQALFTALNQNTNIEKISKALISCSSDIENSNYGPILLNTIFKKDDTLRRQWLESIKQRIDSASLPAIILLTEQFPCHPLVKELLQSKESNESLELEIENILKLAAYQTTCSHDCNSLKTKHTTPTYNHLNQLSKTLIQRYRKLLTENNLPLLVDNPHNLFDFYKSSNQHLETMINEVIKKEKELHITGDYYTFIHGQKCEYLLFEQLHTFLQQVADQKTSQEYIFLHVKPRIKDTTLLKEEKKLRNHLLQNGIIAGILDRREELKLLFVNWAYFSNTTRKGASSASYIKENNNVNNVTISFEDTFRINNISHLYPKYKDKLEELHTIFKNLTDFGTCILVAVPKKTINKHIYSSAGFGVKKSIIIDGIGETDNMNIIMETLTKQPEKVNESDQTEFCIPMTFDKKGALNPESGIKFYAFTAADQEKLDDYYARQKSLFEEIKKDIERDKKIIDSQIFW